MTVRRALVRRPLLDPRFRFAVVPDEGVVLLSPAADVLLQGSLYEKLIPLLDGARTTDAIVDTLGRTVDAAEVYYALGRLQTKGLISAPAAVNSQKTPRRGATLARATRLVTVNLDRNAARRALRAAGWPTSVHAQTWLVIADDILASELLTVDAAAKRAGRSWLLIVPHVRTPSVGPLFTRDGPCFVCLSHRVLGNRPLDAFFRKHGHAPRCAGAPVSLMNGSMLRRTLTHAARVLDTAGHERTLDTWNDVSRRWEQHGVPRRPQCTVCGDATMYPRSSRLAFRTTESPPLGDVSITLRRDLVDSVTGIVTVLEPHPVASLEPLHICVAAGGSTRSRDRLKDVLQDMQQQPSGRGATPVDAAASALGEAVERYSGVWQGDEPRTRSSLTELRARGIHPNDVMCFSAAQLRRHHRAGAESPLARIPRRFDPTVRMDWTPVYSLTRHEERWLPSALLYYGHREATRLGYCFADSNGCAAGETHADALARGLLELIERDAVAIWWYNRLRRPVLDIASARDPWCDAMAQALRAAGREVWALDLTNDLAIPAVAAVARRLTGPEKILLGFGAHTDWRLALRRALGELGQMFAGTADGEPEEPHLGAEMRDWLTHATLRRHSYLRPRLTARRVPKEPTPTDGQALASRILARLHAHGFEVLTLDQTRPDLRVPVVRAIVPGLRHFWPRFGAGRLYDVPIALRWLREPRREKDLNPTACFL